MLTFLTGHGVEILLGLLQILGGFSILAKLTPTPKDDKLIDKVLAVIHALGLTKK